MTVYICFNLSEKFMKLNCFLVIEEKGVKMRLTVIDTPGFGDQINNENWYEKLDQHYSVFGNMKIRHKSLLLLEIMLMLVVTPQLGAHHHVHQRAVREIS